MRVGSLLDHLRTLEAALGDDLRAAAERHRAEHDVHHQCRDFAVTADARADKLAPHTGRYAGQASWTSAVHGTSNDLLEDLRALRLRTDEVAITWTMAAQAAMAVRDQELLTLARVCTTETEWQAKWLTSRIKTGVPQALVTS